MVSQKLQPLQYLEKAKFFSKIKSGDLEKILELATSKTLKKDDRLFYQGDPEKNFYLVINGRIKLDQVNKDGEQVIHYYPGPGEVFGIIAVLREIDFPVSGKAIEDTELIFWSRETMISMMADYPQLALNAIQILSNFILDFQTRIQELSSQRVERRIANTLLRIAEQTGKKIGRGVVIDFRMSRQDIAEYSGTTLFTVSRTLSKWEKAGLVKCEVGKIILQEPHQLVKISEDID